MGIISALVGIIGDELIFFYGSSRIKELSTKKRVLLSEDNLWSGVFVPHVWRNTHFCQVVAESALNFLVIIFAALSSISILANVNRLDIPGIINLEYNTVEFLIVPLFCRVRSKDGKISFDIYIGT